MTRTRRAAVALLLVAVVSLSVVPATAVAESRTGGTVVVEADETVDGLQVFAGTAVVRGTVQGDLEGVAGTVVVQGTVTGNVDATAGSVQIDGDVGGDVQVAAGSLTVGENATVGGDLRVGAGTVRIDGTVDGTVESGAEVTALGPTARIGGDLRYSEDLERADGATVDGTTVRDTSLSASHGAFGGAVPTVAGWLFSLYFLVVNVVVGALLLALLPDFAAGVRERVGGAPLRSAGVGLLALFGVPVALVAVALTVVGIPLTVAGIFAYVLLLWVGYVLGAYGVGAWALGYADVTNRWAALLAGLVGVTVVGGIPWLGGLVEFAVLLLGLGAVVASVYRGLRARRGGEDGATADAAT